MIKMKEQLISLECAKLAKEKGFKELCCHYYDGPKLKESYLENGSSTDVEFRVEYSDLLENFNFRNEYSVPTQSLLQKWLREVHHIEVYTRKTFIPNDETLYYISFVDKIGCIEKYFINYEEALEQGLKQALKLIQL